MNTSKFTKAELEDHIEILERTIEQLERKLEDIRDEWEELVEEKDQEIASVQGQFRSAFEEGFMLAHKQECSLATNTISGISLERAWLTSQTRRKHGAGE